MTPLPKRRISRQRQGKRRAAIKLDAVTISKCPNCGMPIKPHNVCKGCGMYDGKLVIAKKEKAKNANQEV